MAHEGNIPDRRCLIERLGRVTGRSKLGFADPIKLVTASPTVLGLAINNIRGKIADLRELGFADPVKMITSTPAILTYAIDNIRGKIADLRELGFADPVKMFTSSPTVLSLAINNIRGKIADLQELGFCQRWRDRQRRCAVPDQESTAHRTGSPHQQT